MRFRLLPVLVTGLLLASCGGAAPTTPTDDLLSSSSSSESAIVETHNVSFTGTVRPAGISIYMEGTHRLELGDGRFILLASDTVDLNGYVGEQAEVTGSIRPTVEEGGAIMRVEQIRLLERSSASSTDADPSADPSAASAAVSSSVALSSASSPASVASSTPSSKSASVASASRSSSAASVASVAVDVSAQVTSMAKQNLATANWTQAYCAPPTIGFCVPVHRNWYFKSFGTASEALWHVEVGSLSIENISDGPITVNLFGGALSTKGIADNEVRDDGSTVRGYREWTKDRHIEISAPSALMEAVTYMTQHLSAMEE
ncbi:MAG: hypothetical protein PHX87_06395 [Candidatus Peribacteraceae bacterium]|nr:hypothetical protein [Candidatus Peribacteraceae bacterium]MDD5743019.1 hypothetical protein [Candidatus Peribacteraceae bacterium]